jgi:hypothetical protein
MNKWLYLLLMLTICCTKQDLEQNLEPDCKNLQEGIISNDISRVDSSFSNFIADLANKTHTTENLTSLAQKISNRCSVKVDVSCYKCIKTLPEQSHLKVSFSRSGAIIKKVIDISEESSKEMRFVNMHD